jgi:glyoxylase-like metal-dependent hydrolase (beta-lactamase superfamily II)
VRCGRSLFQSDATRPDGAGTTGSRGRSQARSEDGAEGALDCLAVKVGDIDILPVTDGVGRVVPSDAYAGRAFPGADLLPTPTGRGIEAADWEPHRALLDDQGMLTLAIGAFLIRVGDRLVLVDAGLGPLDIGIMRGGALLSELAALGVGPDDITDVVLTHLHIDHVGWTTQKGAVIFEKATYRCDRRDWEHFVGPDPGATRKLSPLQSRLETWDSSGPLLPGVDTMAAPGHTPGSTILVISSGADRAMLLGDVVHCAVELLDEEWAGMSDVDPDLALRTRQAVIRELEGSDIPVAAAHFPGMQFGRLLAGRGKRSWVFDQTPVA